VYSQPLVHNGITWRLKVYPNGNGSNAHGNYISVFLEMQKGIATEAHKYEYRVEMISQDGSREVTRQFSSDFEVGECWGYNRFYRIDQLEPEQYLNDDDSILLKFYVRAPTYSQLCRD
jgi:tripartite motif-containing protein 37